MYTSFTPKRILNFSVLSVLLLTSIFATLHFEKRNSLEYDVWMNNTFAWLKRSGSTLMYVVNFSNKGNNLSLASYVTDFGKNLKSSYVLNDGTNLSPDNTAYDIPVLLYHGLVKNSDDFSMTSKVFADEMLKLKNDGWNTISLTDLSDFMNGKKDLPKKSFLLTFDDGRKDSYEGADPILSALGFKAVMFVATADSLRKDRSLYSYYLNESEINNMISSGRWEIGSHAVQSTGGYVEINDKGDTGNFLSNKKILDSGELETSSQYQDRIKYELSQSKIDLEKTFNIKVDTFSYPFSDYGQQTQNNPQSREIINQTVQDDYLLAFRQSWPGRSLYLSNYSDFDHYYLHRIEVGANWSGDYLVNFLNKASTKFFPFEDNLNSDVGWRNSWGQMAISNGALSLGATASTTGGFAFLDGAYLWKNYIYSVDIDWKNGDYVSLISRFSDSDNYVACTYSEESVRIDEVVNGVITNKFYSLNWVKLPATKVNLSMSVNDNEIKCYEGSRLIGDIYENDEIPIHGGIGIKVWDKNLGIASGDVLSVKVLPIQLEKELIDLLPEYEAN